MADALVTVNQSYRGKTIANVLCFSNITFNTVELQEFADNFRASYVTHVVNFFLNDWSMSSLTFGFIDNDSIPFSYNQGFTLGALVGGSGGDDLPATSPMLISTGYVGPKPNRGRIYVSCLPETEFNGGSYSLSIRSAFEGLVNEWKDGISNGSGDCFLRICRRPSDKFPAYVSSPVQSVIARQNQASQKRRRLGKN